jgi:hypothetical protein
VSPDPNSPRRLPIDGPGAFIARDHLVQRLTTRHGLDHDTAYTAVTQVMLGDKTGPHAQFVREEALAVINEITAPIAAEVRRFLVQFRSAFEQIGRHWKATIEQASALQQQVSLEPLARRDRPAWQSTYGPASRRH